MNIDQRLSGIGEREINTLLSFSKVFYAIKDKIQLRILFFKKMLEALSKDNNNHSYILSEKIVSDPSGERMQLFLSYSLDEIEKRSDMSYIKAIKDLCL